MPLPSSTRSAATAYMGTAPTMTGELSRIRRRVRDRSRPVDRSMTLCAPALTAASSLASSTSTEPCTPDVPMLALTLVRSP